MSECFWYFFFYSPPFYQPSHKCEGGGGHYLLFHIPLHLSTALLRSHHLSISSHRQARRNHRGPAFSLMWQMGHAKGDEKEQ